MLVVLRVKRKIPLYLRRDFLFSGMKFFVSHYTAPKFIVFLSLYTGSCSLAKISPPGNTIADCEEVFLSKNTGSKAQLVNTVVFDSTAILVHVKITDGKTGKSIPGAEIFLFNSAGTIPLKNTQETDFEFFGDLLPVKWNLLFKHSGYKCLIVHDVISSGGQWIRIIPEKY